MVSKLWLFILFCCPAGVVAQNTVRRSFGFLQVPNHARLAGLSNVNVSLADRDVNFYYSNPSLVGDTLAGEASASYQFYIADVGQAAFSYAHRYRTIGTVVMGIQHLGYGTIQGYDDTGAATGNFKSGETALLISKSHQISTFRIGATLKTVFSNIAGYHASAVLLDIGGVYMHPEHDLAVGLVIKNFGFIWSEYSSTSNTRLPFDVQAGVTFKPEHMPARLSLTVYNLMNPSVYYDSQSGEPEPGTLDKVFGRLTFGAEVLVHKHVNVLLGYNYRVHQELKLEDAGGGSGFTFGFSLRVKTFEFTFSRGTYVIGNAGYAFSLSKNINTLLKRG